MRIQPKVAPICAIIFTMFILAVILALGLVEGLRYLITNVAGW